MNVHLECGCALAVRQSACPRRFLALSSPVDNISTHAVGRYCHLAGRRTD